jgi:hypothetical protein
MIKSQFSYSYYQTINFRNVFSDDKCGLTDLQTFTLMHLRNPHTKGTETVGSMKR